MVYLLHFAQPYKHARHYIGFARTARSFGERIEHHRNGSGARLMRVVTEAGIDFEVARIWKKGDRSFERHLKTVYHGPRLCPICSGRAALARAAL